VNPISELVSRAQAGDLEAYGRIPRYALTLPLLLTVRYEGKPLRILAAGKAHRLGRIDAMHLEAFHQAEVLCLDERARLDPLARDRPGTSIGRSSAPRPFGEDLV
jgi:hypothetical protein